MMEQLIKAFEEEKRNLERFIKEAVIDNPEEPDYLTAFQYEQGLTRVNHFLEVLRTFDDVYYREKQWCHDFIQRHADADKRSIYINERLKEKKEQLRALESRPSLCLDKSYILRETFQELIIGEISGFNWVLREDLRFRFLYKPKRMLIFCDLIFANKTHASFIGMEQLLLRGFIRSGARRVCLKWLCRKDGSGINGLMMHLAAVIYDLLCIFPGQTGSRLELF